MSARQKVQEEIRLLIETMLYFVIWFGVLVALKRLLLADYEIKFRGLSLALLGALIVAKVVLLMEHVSLGQWVRRHPVVIDVILRTLICTAGVFVVMLLEKGIEGRHEHGGVGGAITWLFQQRDMYHVWADTIAVSGGLLVFNALSVVRRHLGQGQLRRLFLSPPKPLKL